MTAKQKMILRGAGLAAILALGACATNVPYGPAASATAKGYMVQPIENNRIRITNRDNTMEHAQSRALRRAAEVTLEQGDDWFQIVTAFTDTGELAGGGGTSVSVGGSSGSGGYSNFGVGVGIA